MGLGGVLLITRNSRQVEEQARAVTVQPPTPIPATNTPTSTITPTPTNTPEPTSTSTPVINNQGQPAQEEAPAEPEQPVETDEDSPEAIAEIDQEGQSEHDADLSDEATPINTPVVQTPTSMVEPPAATSTPQEIPTSGGILPPGNHPFLLWAAGGLILALLIGALRRSRSP